MVAILLRPQFVDLHLWKRPKEDTWHCSCSHVVTLNCTLSVVKLVLCDYQGLCL